MLRHCDRSLAFGALVEDQEAVADLDHISRMERRGVANALAVDESAARRIGIDQDVAVAFLNNPGVQRLDTGIAEQADVAAFAAPNGRFGLGDDELSAG